MKSSRSLSISCARNQAPKRVPFFGPLATTYIIAFLILEISGAEAEHFLRNIPQTTNSPPRHLQDAQNTLIWRDEFDGGLIDLSKWTHEVNGDGGGNNELQYYTDRANNSFVRDGFLHIVANKENFLGKEYTSARLNTRGKFAFRHGRIDARIKLPPGGQGIWPAFWMLPEDNVYGGWPTSGEIDIMEYVGSDPRTVLGTVHFGDSYPNNRYVGSRTTISGSFSDKFHVFSLIWKPYNITWLVDGVPYATRNPSELGNCIYGPCIWPFEERFHFLLNFAVGGFLPGPPNKDTPFPQEMLVDYVRVYDLSSTPDFTAAPTPAPTAAYCSPVEVSVDYRGNDLTSTRRSNAGLCCADCFATPNCTTFVWTDYEGGSCWLKYAKGEKLTKPGAIAASLLLPPRPASTAASSPTDVPTPEPTVAPILPSATPTSAPTLVPTQAPTPFSTTAPTLVATLAPTPVPTLALTLVPTSAPTVVPTSAPTPVPTPAPTFLTTSAPTLVPTPAPTPVPTSAPTAVPTPAQTLVPTSAPTVVPTSAPTVVPTSAPTTVPTPGPTFVPTSAPTLVPTPAPTPVPTSAPTAVPPPAPTFVPTSAPTLVPTSAPTVIPTSAPTVVPTSAPTAVPTPAPTFVPTSAPTLVPTPAPTPVPTSAPTAVPTPAPTFVPTSAPTLVPTSAPTVLSTSAPTAVPTPAPTFVPTSAPTLVPTSAPTAVPTPAPTLLPTSAPPVVPTSAPTAVPIPAPTFVPTSAPTLVPTSAPTAVPTTAPIVVPTTSAPTAVPTTAPTSIPTSAPPSAPTMAPSPSPPQSPTPGPTVALTTAPTTSLTPIPTPSATLTPTLTPSPALQQCVPLELDMDYPGNDIRSTSRSSADLCCQDCQDTLGCTSFVWTDYVGGTCWLKTSRGVAVFQAGARASYIISSTLAPTLVLTPGPTPVPMPSPTLAATATPIPASQQCSPLEVDVDYPGNDIKSTSRPNADLCCQDCENTVGCTTLVWTNYLGGTCWLKYSKGARINMPGARAASVIESSSLPRPTITPEVVPTATPTTSPTPTSLPTVLPTAVPTAAPTVTPSPTLDECAPLELNIDYPGNDIRSTLRATAELCCQDCKDTVGCTMFVWTNYLGGTCWLKSKKGPGVAKEEARASYYLVPPQTLVPTYVPTTTPTAAPTFVSTAIPTAAPTLVPTFPPTLLPTPIPTEIQTPAPTRLPTPAPTAPPSLAPTLLPTTSNGTCYPVEQDVDYYSANVATVQRPNATDCCEECRTNPNCNAYSWTSYNGGTCWLKASKGQGVPKAGVFSARYYKCSSLDVGVDYVGNDIGSYPGSEPEECCPICRGTVGCRAFTWSSYEGGTCWLKSKKGDALAKAGVVSATVV